MSARRNMQVEAKVKAKEQNDRARKGSSELQEKKRHMREAQPNIQVKGWKGKTHRRK